MNALATMLAAISGESVVGALVWLVILGRGVLVTLVAHQLHWTARTIQQGGARDLGGGGGAASHQRAARFGWTSDYRLEMTFGPV